MENLGERLVGDYLRYIKQCDFVDYNVYTKTVQGEIDVIGINLTRRAAYVCEVATHLTTGLQYVKNARPDTAERLTKKFLKDIEYGEAAFNGYAVTYMLWSPVVRHSQGKPEYDQFEHLRQVRDNINKQTGIEIDFVINHRYISVLEELRAYARSETKEMKSPVMRLLQIEQWAQKNADRASNKGVILTGDPLRGLPGSTPVTLGEKEQ